jgi:tetratricopeptide (TPR) repeat protein
LQNAEARLWNIGDAGVAFSPDGRWLVSGTGAVGGSPAECCFWKVGTWERGPSIPLQRTTSPAEVAFSDEGRMLAVARTMTELALYDPRDLRELARLQSREPMILVALCFSPDGSVLAAGTASGYIHVWDLRQVRARLEGMNLDWDLPALDPPPAASMTALPLEVDLRLDMSSLVERANYFLEKPDDRRARVDFEEALAREPDRPDIRHGLVGILTHGPVGLRDLGRAEELVRAALRRDATQPADRGDLGMIRYRRGLYTEAEEALEQAIRGSTDPLDRARWWILLAMSQRRLGQARAAQESYQRARSELAQAKPAPAAAAVFARFCAEADATLRAEPRN